jgi:hypothetical protein
MKLKFSKVVIVVVLVLVLLAFLFFRREGYDEEQFLKNLESINPPLSPEVKMNLKNLYNSSQSMPTMKEIVDAMNMETSPPGQKPPEPIDTVFKYFAKEFVKDYKGPVV